MQKVHGIGGFFFRARDPDGLAKWYATHLGVDLTPQTYDENGWTTHAGTTVFQIHNPGGMQGTRAFQFLVSTSSGTFAGSSNAAQF